MADKVGVVTMLVAVRAKSYGMPLREAMAHLGHGSKAVHQANSDKAEIVTLPLEYYEKQWEEKVVQFKQAAPMPGLDLAMAGNSYSATRTL